MAGFASPSILFLSTWDAPERSFCKAVFESLKGRGYTRFVEPCAGAFAMPLVAHAAGWAGWEMEASDTSLFSSVVGTMLDLSQRFEDLEIRLDGELVSIPEDRIDAAAKLLWLQLLTRTQCKPDAEYWNRLVEDLIERGDDHRAAIRRKLVSMADRIGGLSYVPMDMWTHIEQVADDPHSIVSINPPTYRAGFEKFFDTHGRLTWAEPEYEIFDPIVGIPKLIDVMEGRNALLVCQQQREPGQSAHPTPIYARYLSPGQNVYLNSNRPEEIFEITGGPKVAVRRLSPVEPLPYPILPRTYEIQPESRLELLAVKPGVADYYRNLWMHRLVASPGSMNVAVLVDGYVAGILGYNLDSMSHPHPGRPAGHPIDRYVILRFAFGAPHDIYRLTRLATMAALQRSTIDPLVTPNSVLYLEASKGAVTVEYTKHPESKGLRGLMKLAERREDPKEGFQLFYTGDWTYHEDLLKLYLTREAAWRKARG